MNIKNMALRNKTLNLNNLKLDLSKYGIYMLSGKNGCGKTSLIKRIVFDNNKNIVFNTKEHEECYIRDRHNLISYLPQDTISYSIKVSEYIVKTNKKVKEESIYELLKMFKMDDIQLNQNFQNLSGGEKKKVAIISALLKNTPYIILDEPTNNLDDKSVELLIDIIKELSANRTFLIVSHDPRLMFDKYNELHMENGIIYNKILDEASINNDSCSEIVPNFLKIAFKTISSKINWAIMMFYLILLLLCVVFLDIQFLRGYSTDVLPPKNTILTYKADYVYDELNKEYVSGAKIKINPQNHYNIINYNDIPKIANIKGVKDIVLYDFEYLTRMYFELVKGMSDKILNIISIPNIVYSNYSSIRNNDLINVLMDGRFPTDYSNEIAISENLLTKFFGFNNDQLSNALGSTIILDNVEYRIVGISYYDICYISYDKKQNYGFYTYEPSTYQEFIDRNMSYKEELEATPEEADELIIFTNDGQEELVLNQLMMQFPGENYVSYIYTKVWVKSFNTKFLAKITFITIMISALIGLVALFLYKNQLYIIANKIMDYENYYFTKKIKIYCLLIIILQFVIINLITTIFNLYYSKLSYVNNHIIIIGSIIIFLPSIIYTRWRLRHGWKV